MGAVHAWIRARREEVSGTLHLTRAQAMAEAAVREGLDSVTLLLDEPDRQVLENRVPSQVTVETMPPGLTAPQEAARIVGMFKPHVPKRVDSRHPRPLVYLLGESYDQAYQRQIWKAGAETVVISDEGLATWADWFALPKPYGAEAIIPSWSGYTRYLRGAQYVPLRSDSVKAILRHRDHATTAQKFAIATENLDLDWLPRIVAAINALELPEHFDREWKPSLLLMPGIDCPSDDELKNALGDTGSLPVTISQERWQHVEELMQVDLLFSADNVTLQESLPLGTVRVVLPRKGDEEDLMYDHLTRREASPELPKLDSAEFVKEMVTALTRVCFDAAYRRGQNRIGQYLCDGIGAVRLVRSTAYKIYVNPQNLVRYFDLGDPMIEAL